MTLQIFSTMFGSLEIEATHFWGVNYFEFLLSMKQLGESEWSPISDFPRGFAGFGEGQKVAQMKLVVDEI